MRDGRITESHARLLLTLQSQPQEQKALMDDIIFRGLNVRETERLTKELTAGVKKEIKNLDPETKTLEEKLAAALGARVYISKNESGGRVSIEFFSPEELRAFVERFEPEPMSPEGQVVLAEVRPEDLEEFTI